MATWASDVVVWPGATLPAVVWAVAVVGEGGRPQEPSANSFPQAAALLMLKAVTVSFCDIWF